MVNLPKLKDHIGVIKVTTDQFNLPQDACDICWKRGCFEYAVKVSMGEAHR